MLGGGRKRSQLLLVQGIGKDSGIVGATVPLAEKSGIISAVQQYVACLHAEN